MRSWQSRASRRWGAQELTRLGRKMRRCGVGAFTPFRMFGDGQHTSERDCLALLPNACLFSGASISVSRTLTCSRPFMTVMLSPSATATTFPAKSARADTAISSAIRPAVKETARVLTKVIPLFFGMESGDPHLNQRGYQPKPIFAKQPDVSILERTVTARQGS